AEALELEEEVAFARDREELVRHLELVVLRPPDERLVAEHLRGADREDGLEDGAELLPREDRLEPLDEGLLLAALSRVREARRLPERAHHVARRADARVVGHGERRRVDVHEVDGRAAERLAQPAHDARPQTRRLALERSPAATRRPALEVEEEEDA